MPRSVSIPDSLGALLTRFRPCFSRRGFEVFTAMFAGFILQPVQRTVCGMLTGAGLAGVWHHSRAHRFFANTRWDTAEFGLILAGLVLHAAADPARHADPACRRRDPDAAPRTEGVRHLLVAGRVGRRAAQDR